MAGGGRGDEGDIGFVRGRQCRTPVTEGLGLPCAVLTIFK